MGLGAFSNEIKNLIRGGGIFPCGLFAMGGVFGEGMCVC